MKPSSGKKKNAPPPGKEGRSAAVEKRLDQGLQEADQIMAAHQWLEAHARLEDLYRRFPDQPEVLSRMLNTSYEIGDTERYQEVCEKLLAILPGDEELSLALAGAFMLNSRPALARKTFMDFVERWPEHASVPEVRKSVDEIDHYLAEMAQENQLELAATTRLLEMHERMQSLHFQGRNRQAIHLGEKILREFPNYLPVYNNLSQLSWLLDKRDDAIRYTHAALERDGQNLHARADLVVYRLLTGQAEQARRDAEQLRDTSKAPLPHMYKAIEAFGYLGDDQAVLKAYQAIRRQPGFEQMGHGAAVIHHLVAVAHLRTGNEAEARKIWERALQISPNYDHAAANLRDLEQPPSLRQAPWAFRLAQWMPEKTVRELLTRFDPSHPRGDEHAMQSMAAEFLEKHPAVASLAPFMLNSGDEASRDFILVLARYTDDTRMLDAVREFAFGKGGPDPARLEAAQILVHAGVLPSGMQKMWINGKWIEILLAGIRIGNEVRRVHSEEVASLLGRAYADLENGDGDSAAMHLLQALELEPEAPDASFNLAAAYQLQGRQDEAEQLVERIHQEFPDYPFGITGLAQILIGRQEYDQARHVLSPLFYAREMKPSEFDAFCGVNIELHLTEGNRAAAQAWFGFWESANPENPRLEVYRIKLENWMDDRSKEGGKD